MVTNFFNTVLLCLISVESRGIFPGYRAQLYMKIIQCIFRRYRKKKGLPETSEDITERVDDAQLEHLDWIALINYWKTTWILRKVSLKVMHT